MIDFESNKYEEILRKQRVSVFFEVWGKKDNLPTGLLLLLRRTGDSNYSGRYELPGGKIDTDLGVKFKKYKTGIAELMQETGLNVLPHLAPGRVDLVDIGHESLLAFKMRYKGILLDIKLSDEHDQAMWWNATSLIWNISDEEKMEFINKTKAELDRNCLIQDGQEYPITDFCKMGMLSYLDYYRQRDTIYIPK